MTRRLALNWGDRVEKRRRVLELGIGRLGHLLSIRREGGKGVVGLMHGFVRSAGDSVGPATPNEP